MPFTPFMIAPPAAPPRFEKRDSALRIARLIVLVTLLKPVSNLLLAWGARQLPSILTAHPVLMLQSVMDPFVVVGIILQIAWILLRLSLLSAADLSFVLPVTAAGYVISTVLGRIVLHEAVSLARWSGTILISAGMALVASTPRLTTEPAEAVP